MLPKLPNRDQIKKAQTVQFSGLNKNPAAPDGTLWDTINMGSDKMPCLSPRKRRWQVGQFNNCCGMYPYNGLYLVLGTDILREGVKIGTAVNAEEKLWAAMNDYIIMYPDKIMIDAAETSEEGDADWQSGYVVTEQCRFRRTDNFSYDTLSTENQEQPFDLLPRAGDTVTISGSSIGLNNKTAVVSFVSNNKRILGFPKYTFTPTAADEEITLTKAKPSDIALVNLPVVFENSDEGSGYSVIMPKDSIDLTKTAFKVGDNVTITGSSVPGNNKTATLQGVGPNSFVFLANTFTSTDDWEPISIHKAAGPVNAVTPMEVRLTQQNVVFEDEDPNDVAKKNNQITLQSGERWSDKGLRIGDAVRIVRNQTTIGPIIIRNMDGDKLIFSPGSFENTPSGTEDIDMTRTMPDLDGIFVHENRLWGWKGSTIYASKQGDPLNFEIFDGLADDSWTWDMDGTGDILGAIVYQGYPTFFKEDKVVRIYGDRPTQYRVMDVSAMGIHPGCGKSLAISGDTLFYVSRNGLAAYKGGYSQDIHDPFGEIKITQATAGSDGRRYFLSAYYSGQWALFVYDTVWNCWFREDNGEISDFACDRGNLYFLRWRSGAQYLLVDGHAPTPPRTATKESELSSEVVWNDFTGNYWTAGRGYGNPSRKGTSKIQLRVTMEAGSTLDVFISFDVDDELLVKHLEAGTGKHSYYLPIIPRRSDNYKIILRGSGDWTLNSLVREEYSGSDIH